MSWCVSGKKVVEGARQGWGSVGGNEPSRNNDVFNDQNNE